MFSCCASCILIHNLRIVAELNALFATTGGPSGKWTNSNGWSTGGDDPCLWYGVQCDDSHTHVTAVLLHDNGLHGHVPALSDGFSSLERVDLSDNALFGTFSSTWTNLPSIVSINMENCFVSSPLPGGLTEFPATFTSLNLRNNSLTGPVPPTLGAISYDFDLRDNRFSCYSASTATAVTLPSNVHMSDCKPASVDEEVSRVLLAWMLMFLLAIVLIMGCGMGCTSVAFRPPRYAKVSEETEMEETVIVGDDNSVSNIIM